MNNRSKETIHYEQMGVGNKEMVLTIDDDDHKRMIYPPLFLHEEILLLYINPLQEESSR